MPSDSTGSLNCIAVPETNGSHYHVGPDAAGRWLAVETHGLGGGLFVTRDAALRFARVETGRRPGAVDLVERLVAFAA